MPAPYFFFFNDTATTEIYTLSLHDALPISVGAGDPASRWMTSCRDRPSANRRLAVWYVGLSSSRQSSSTTWYAASTNSSLVRPGGGVHPPNSSATRR